MGRNARTLMNCGKWIDWVCEDKCEDKEDKSVKSF
jgi:hypothetical protein